MQTAISPELQTTAEGRRAEEVLRKCVHCGLCNATCPTYELLGDELDSPRGRIYQMKQLFEGQIADKQAGNTIRLHLDRCLLCRACESACPSGVQYSVLLEASKAVLDARFPRAAAGRIGRRLLGGVIARPTRFALLWAMGRAVKKILPARLARSMGMASVPNPQHPLARVWPAPRHGRKMLALAGCVQSVITPNTNLAAATLLDRLGISLIEVAGAGCCGGVQLHTEGHTEGMHQPTARATARALIDRWLPQLADVEAVVMTASGCGLTIREYPLLFADDPEYREKARQLSEKVVDLSTVIKAELPPDYTPETAPQRVAYHAPCTLQHAQRNRGTVEFVLAQAGHTLCAVRDGHLCCGSAGTYSLLQRRLSTRLRHAKQAALTAHAPQVICTANVGCQLHLNVDAKTPVVHWVELLL